MWSSFRKKIEKPQPTPEKPPVTPEPASNAKNKNIIIIVLVVVVVILGIMVVFMMGKNSSNSSPVANNQEEIEEESNTDIDVPDDLDDEDISFEIDEGEVEEMRKIKVDYKLNYNMLTRDAPGYNANKVGGYDKGDIVTIYEIKATEERNSLWGRLENNHWICLEDDDYIYCTEY